PTFGQLTRSIRGLRRVEWGSDRPLQARRCRGATRKPARLQQFTVIVRRLVVRSLRQLRQIALVVDRRGTVGLEEGVGQLDRGRYRARNVARARIDLETLEVIPGAVHQVTVLVDLEVAAAGEVVRAGEHRVAVRLTDL